MWLTPPVCLTANFLSGTQTKLFHKIWARQNRLQNEAAFSNPSEKPATREMQEQPGLTLPDSSSSTDKHNKLSQRFKPEQQLPPLELTRPSQRWKKCLDWGKGADFPSDLEMHGCVSSLFLSLLSKLTVNSRGFWDGELQRIFQINAALFIFMETVWITPLKMAAWEADGCWRRFPKRQGKSEECGRHQTLWPRKTRPEVYQGLC